MRPPRIWLIALAVAVVALAPRLLWLGADLFHTDSVFQARAVEAWVLRGEFTYMHRPGYPGQVLLSAPLFWLHHLLTGATSAAFAVTLQSALAGALAAGLAVVFARPFVRTDAGAAAAGLVVAALPTLLSTTTFAMSHGTQVVLLLAAGIAAERRRGIATGALLGLAIATRTESVFVAPALLLLLWRGDVPVGFDRERGLHLRVGMGALTARLAAFAVPLVAVPLALYGKQFANEGLAQWREASDDTGWLGPVSIMLPDGLDGMVRTLTRLGVVAALWGLVTLWRRDHTRAVVVLLWLLVPLAFVANTQIVVPRHLIVAVVVLAVPIAAGLDTLRGAGRVVGGTVLVALLAWMIVPLAPTLNRRSRACGPADFARRIAQLTEPEAVVVAMDFSEHVDYYSARRTLSREPLDRTAADDARIEASLAELRTLLAAGTPVYVTSDAFAYDVPHPDLGLLKVEIGMTTTDAAGGREVIGRWGIALIESIELEHVVSGPYEDWHGAALGRRRGASGVASLYRAVPAND